VPFGPDISSAIFALGFANRAAMAFGGVQPGDYKKMLMYNKDRIFAFVNALGDVGTEWAAAAAGCVNWGFPTLADTDIPEILPTGICTYEHVVANVPHDEMVQKSVEVRGLKVTISEIDIPCPSARPTRASGCAAPICIPRWAAARPRPPSWSKWPR
jgi:acetyl-CoA synthase